MPVSSFSTTSMVTASSSSKMQDTELICANYVEPETNTEYAKGLLDLYIGSATRYVKQHKANKTTSKILRAEVDLNVLKSLDASDLDPIYKFSWYSAVGILFRNTLLFPRCSFR